MTKPINPADLWKALLHWVKVREGMGTDSGAIAKPLPQVDAGSADVMQALRAIAGLDVEVGLSRTNNNPPFYVSMLRKFVSGQADAVAQARNAWLAGDTLTAERIAHTLKGVAGNLGAAPVQDSAEHLETALRTHAPQAELQAALTTAAQHVQSLMAALSATPGLLPSEPAAAGATLTQAQRQAALEVSARIRALLADDDASALDLWEANAPTLSALYGNACEIEAAIGGFDFEGALALLDEASA